MDTEVTFDEAKHEYRLNGKPVLSVTQIIKAVFGNQWGHLPAWYAQRGAAAHAVYALLGQGENLAEYDISKQLTPLVNHWLAWRDAVNPEFVDIERPIYSTKMQYAGTLDAACIIKGKLTLIDYKGSATTDDKWQLGAYKQAYEERGGKEIKQAAVVEITPDGWKMGAMLAGGDLRRAVMEFNAIRTVQRLMEERK